MTRKGTVQKIELKNKLKTIKNQTKRCQPIFFSTKNYTKSFKTKKKKTRELKTKSLKNLSFKFFFLIFFCFGFAIYDNFTPGHPVFVFIC